MAMPKGGDPFKVPIPGIFVFPQTGPGIKLAWAAYNELRQKRRLHMATTQVADLPEIKSKGGGTIYDIVNNFTRRVSLACRIFMARACRMPIEQKTWAKKNKEITPNVQQQQGAPFVLADKETAEYEYYLYNFDHMYPHFMIENEIREAENAQVGAAVSVNRTMLVFRELGGVDDVIEIGCTVRIIPGDYHQGGREYNCVVSSRCIRSLIQPLEGQRCPWYKHLRKICFMADSQLPCEEVDDVADQLGQMGIQNDDDDDDDDGGDDDDDGGAGGDDR